ncbi:NADH-dependent phenylglyoxylate dehydrogenase subunit epsilon [uncultured Rhodospira sp.]|uniref:NADH-dependent phenylglyoxylate dehydrogenase subunit epsilon n=1 Tax=uncultured Rhodospira sp. TaxID=1936189 RepID=UPI00262995BC|nr:FAD-dependent oxidoreductase [uncultured Rhodospira sp.]
MPDTDYLIVGSSHAALEAVTAIRMHDHSGSVTLVTRDRHPPYSPTILPYVVSGRAKPERVPLRDSGWFAAQGATFVREDALVGLDPDAFTARLESGAMWRYGKLLLATGARPVVPDIAGLETVPRHVLRTLDDAVALREAIGAARRAVVLGAGLVGMHAAENLVTAGLDVTIVERGAHPLPLYFGATAAAMIGQAFAARGARLLCGRTVASAQGGGDGAVALALDDGETLATDLLVVAAGVVPETGYLAGTDIGLGAAGGILVDAHMRTTRPGIWAAGDVTEGPAFGGGVAVSGILPSAVDQGRIAGMDMAGDRVPPYDGAIPLNTYAAFGRHAVSVGDALAEGDDLDVHEDGDPETGRYRRLVLRDGRLVGATVIGEAIDGGILRQLILRRTDLTPVKDAFLAAPRDTARVLMSRLWR